MARDDKRERIMQAAERLFTFRRFHEVTLDRVARDAKVGKGTIYLYFKDKDDLFFQVATAGFEELCDILSLRLPPSAPCREQLIAAAEAIGAFYQQRRQLLRLMQSEESRLLSHRGRNRERWLEKRRGLIRALGVILARGVAEGTVRHDLPPEALAAFLLGLLRARARDFENPDAVPRAMVVDLFLHGAGRLRPDRHRPSSRASARGRTARGQQEIRQT